MRRIVLLTFLSISLLPLSSFAVQGDVSISSNTKGNTVTARENMLSTIVNSRQMNFTYKSLTVLIDGTLIEPRGRMRGRLISLSAKVVRDSEFLKLFVHELGHYIDIYVLVSQKGKDISSDFYTISWQGSNVKRSTESLSSFVTGYAAANQYEDFAESLVFYIFHNQIFEDRAMRNDALRKKYLFFQQNVFPGGFFTDTDFTVGKVPAYSWDSTKIPISLQKYLYSLN